MESSALGSSAMSAVLERLFAECFAASHETRLVGGGDEPIYVPADSGDSFHRVVYREDFAASALHEVAHWCIAGDARRTLEDYGYWYCPDGRSAEQQRAFEQVEIKPQGLERVFCAAVGLPFRISVDNLEGQVGASESFAKAVHSQSLTYFQGGMPMRGASFVDALKAYSQRSTDEIFQCLLQPL